MSFYYIRFVKGEGLSVFEIKDLGGTLLTNME